MRRVVIILAVLAVSTPALAAINYWQFGVDTDWDNGGNWGLGTEPVAGDHVLWLPGVPMQPVIYTAGNQAGLITPTWHAQTTHMGIKPGADLTMQTAAGGPGYVQMTNTGENSHAMFSIRGAMDAGHTLHMAQNATSTARINLNAGNGGGVLYTGTPFAGSGIGFMYPDTGGQPPTYENAGQNIDIEVGATLYVGGNNFDEINWWANGWQDSPEAGRMLTACDGTGIVTWNYNEATGRTAITAVDPYTNIWSADFEDGEINSAYIGGDPINGINTEALPAAQPSPFSASATFNAALDQDGYGWTNRAAGHAGGGTTVVDTESYTGENSAAVENRTLRSDIPLTLEEGTYRFTFWYMVPEGQDLSFNNKIVMKDQTNGFMFYTENNFIDAPAHDVWFSRTFVIDTNGYAPAVAGDTIQFRFGAWFYDDPGDVVYTDNWSLSYLPEPSALLLLAFGGLALRRRG